MLDFLIDTDTASDDAVALVMALRAPHVRVVAITTVAGNVGVAQATRNALYTAELCGSSVPVYAGAAKPLVREHQSADWFHGRDGMGDHGYPEARQSAGDLHGVDAIIESIEAHPGLVVVTLGPLTNLALALAKRPEIISKVGRCVVMGGAPCCEGNVTPAAEYNIWVDPEAARVVMRSGLPVELVGWQLCRGDAVLGEADITRALRMDTVLARFAIECNSRAREAYREQTGEDGISLPDPVAMAIALDPDVGTQWSEHAVDVETQSDLTRGMTVVDRLNVAEDERNRDVWSLAGRARVCWSIDTARWKAALFRALGCFVLLLLVVSISKLSAQIVGPEVLQKVEPQDDPNLKKFVIDPARVQVTVDESGNPVSLRSTTGLPDNVVEAIEQWRFRPGMKDGKKAEFTVSLDVPIKRPLNEYLRSAIRKSDRPSRNSYSVGARLDANKAVELEKSLSNDESSVEGREQLLKYAAANQSDPASAEMRVRQVTWLVQNQPGAGILASPAARIPKSAPGYDAVKKLWLDQVAKNPKDAVALGHAAWFLESTDPDTIEKLLVPATENVGGAAAWLGKLYGSAALETDPPAGFAAHARSALDTTKDERVLIAALATVIDAGKAPARSDPLPKGYAEFCDNLLTRVKAFDPDTALACPTPEANPPHPAGTITAARLIRQAKPVYPHDAKAHHVQGTLNFTATIGKDGKLFSIEFLDGPLPLYSAARDAVLQWEYQPTTINGEPVEVSTTLNVNFTLGH